MTPRGLARAGLLCVALCGTAAGARSGAPQPFTATYAVQWHGISAGSSTLTLAHSAADTWTYSSRNLANGLFRLAFPNAISQTSTFTLSNGDVQPQSYRSDDGSQNTKQKVSLDFDWHAGRLRGSADGHPVDQPLQPGTQDSLSVQIALMRALALGRSPTSFLMVDGGEIKQYDYQREGNVTLDTALGKLDTIIYSSSRPGSDRVTRLWLAPGLGFLPVRAERKRGDSVDFTMQIRKLARG